MTLLFSSFSALSALTVLSTFSARSDACFRGPVMPANPSFLGYIISSGRQVAASFKVNSWFQLCQIRFSQAIQILKSSLTSSAEAERKMGLHCLTSRELLRGLTWLNSMSLPLAKQGKEDGRGLDDVRGTRSLYPLACLPPRQDYSNPLSCLEKLILWSTWA